MKQTKRWLSLLLAVALVFTCLTGSLPVQAADIVTSGDFRYSVTDNKATITGYIGQGVTVEIPEEIDHYPVVAIGDKVWDFFTSDNIDTIISVKVPETVQRIEREGLFQGCDSLVRVELSDAIRTIPADTFAECVSLTSIDFPSSLSTIGESAFSSCSSLRQVTLPDSVAVINEKAFVDCTSLSSINLSKNLTIIRYAAFQNCRALTEIHIPDSVTLLEGSYYGGIFEGCSVLKRVDLPPNISSIPEKMFQGCIALESVEIPSGVITIGNHAFNDCHSLESVDIPDGVISIGSEVFKNCYSLKEVQLPETLSNLGGNTFSNCSALKSIEIPGNVNSVNDFEDCYSLESVIIHEGVKGVDGFIGCSSLKSITIPGSVISLGEVAFLDCTSLEEVEIQEGVTEIGGGAFSGCSSLRKIIIPESVTKIVPDGAYGGYRRYTFSSVAEDFTIYGVSGSYAQEYANNNHIPFVDINHIPQSGFSAETDGWSFVNHWEGFGYPTGHYRIPEERYKEVFGDSYVATAKANDSTVFESMMPQWGGNCYGMSATAVLFYTGMLNYDDYLKGCENVNDYHQSIETENGIFSDKIYAVSGKDSKITKLIENYQILQSGSAHGYRDEDSTSQSLLGEYYKSEATETGWFNKKYTYEHNPSGNYIKEVLSKIQTSVYPLMLGLSGENGGHAIVARTDMEPVNMADGWYRVYVYDPNSPYMPKSVLDTYGTDLKDYYSNDRDIPLYIELNPEKNQWRYHTPDNQYYGSDFFGNVKYYDSTDTMRIPECLRAFSISTLEDYPTQFKGTEPWTAPEEAEIVIMIPKYASFTVYTPEGEEICEVKNGFPLANMNGVEYDPFMGTIEGEEGTSIGGRLTLPAKDVVIEYESGDDISIIGDDSAINVASEGSMTLDVSIEENQIHAESNTQNDVVVQVTDIYSSEKYTSAYVDGQLDSGDGFTMELNEDKLNVDNQITGSGTLNIYTDNEENPNSQFVDSIGSDGEDIEVEDVREFESDAITCPSGSLHISADSQYISNIQPGSTVEEVTSQLSPANLVVRNADGEELDGSDRIGTGCTISLPEGGPALTVVIFGDVTGDGAINVLDISRVQNYLLAVQDLEGAAKKAALFGKKEVDVMSLLTISGHTLNTQKIDQGYVIE